MSTLSRFSGRCALSAAISAGLLAACGDSGAAPDESTQVDSSFPFSAGDGSVDAAFDSGYAYTPDASPLADAQPADGGGASDAGDGGVASASIGLLGTGLTLLPTSGEPITAADKKWTYVEFPSTSCRDGSKAGVTVYRNTASKKLMFFFEGGGACFDSLTCGANPAAVDDKDKAGPTTGVLDLTRAENPFKDFNVVYVPYCTGDTFGGTKADGNVAGVGPQKFVGYLNTQAFLDRIAPTFPDLTDLVVTGVSAGGFGASISVTQIQRAFPNVKGKLIDDSGPPMSSKVVATCLQKKWRDTWGYDGSMLKECGADCANHDDFILDFGLHLAKTFQGRLSGLIETINDGVISGFYGAGSDFLGGGPCSGAALITPVDAEKFHQGLLEFRTALAPYPTFGTFFPPGNQHTWLMGDSFYTGTVDGTTLLSWVTDIVTDKGTKNVGK